jgi:hypothetical protein
MAMRAKSLAAQRLLSGHAQDAKAVPGRKRFGGGGALIYQFIAVDFLAARSTGWR